MSKNIRVNGAIARLSVNGAIARLSGLLRGISLVARFSGLIYRFGAIGLGGGCHVGGPGWRCRFRFRHAVLLSRRDTSIAVIGCLKSRLNFG